MSVASQPCEIFIPENSIRLKETNIVVNDKLLKIRDKPSVKPARPCNMERLKMKFNFGICSF